MVAKLPGQKSPVGHKPTFAMRSKIPSRSAHEWQVSGDESELRFGLTRPVADGQLAQEATM